eukprot:937289_1
MALFTKRIGQQSQNLLSSCKMSINKKMCRFSHSNSVVRSSYINKFEAKTPSKASFSTSSAPLTVPWFPITMQDMDSSALIILMGGTDLSADHPGFNDEKYRNRRAMVAKAATEFEYGDEATIINYTNEEIECWNTIWRKLQPLFDKYACAEFNEELEGLKHLGYKEDCIPQLCDISNYLQTKTGFRLRPTSGLISPRHFLNGLAFNTFFCTQYMRHHSVPFYTPEPDVVHELVGHAPMFAHPEFAKFSQQIGLMSIGASDEQIQWLTRLYWFSAEFGLVRESPNSNKRKIFGGGLLSSFGEIEYCMSNEPEIHEWDPWHVSLQEFPITKYQPLYYLADSLEDATQKMRDFGNEMHKPFNCMWNAVEQKLEVDRNVKRLPRDHDEALPTDYQQLAEIGNDSVHVYNV